MRFAAEEPMGWADTADPRLVPVRTPVAATGPAWAALQEGLSRLAEVDRATPCAGNPEGWCSEDRHVREQAARVCLARCTLVGVCRAAAEESGDVWHVWGGVDFTEARLEAARDRQRRYVARLRGRGLVS